MAALATPMDTDEPEAMPVTAEAEHAGDAQAQDGPAATVRA
jgi:hypothetical protein